mmetsp:Transcript_21044/g.33724  ORF Transcript_21044/g.33724 Transcript_21044/m.33724 type:complete len:229 (-) Transcript_21044:7-693(-)
MIAQAQTINQMIDMALVETACQSSLKRHIGGNGQRWDQVELLKHQGNIVAAQRRPGRIIHPGQVVATDTDTARIRTLQPARNVQKRAFAAAGFTGQGKGLAPVHSKGDAAQHGHGALNVRKRLLDGVKFKQHIDPLADQYLLHPDTFDRRTRKKPNGSKIGTNRAQLHRTKARLRTDLRHSQAIRPTRYQTGLVTHFRKSGQDRIDFVDFVCAIASMILAGPPLNVSA